MYVGVCVCVYVLELRVDACFEVKSGQERKAMAIAEMGSSVY